MAAAAATGGSAHAHAAAAAVLRTGDESGAFEAAPQDPPSGQNVLDLPDSIRRHLADGRSWRASQALRAHLGPLGSAPLAHRIRLAEAEADWRSWRGVAEALTAGGIDTASAPPRLWYLLGVARAELGHHAGAAADLLRFAAAADAGQGTVDPAREVAAARARAAVLLARAGRADAAAPVLAELATRSADVASWASLAAAEALANDGRAKGVAAMLGLIANPAVRERGWALEADAWAEAADTARALEALEAAAATADARGRSARIELRGREWRYRLTLGDTAGAVGAMEALLAETTSGDRALAAARAHWRHATGSPPDVLRLVARAHASGGEFGVAAAGWRLVVQRGGELTGQERMARARALAGSGGRDAAVEVYRELSQSTDPELAAAALTAWAAVRTSQGRHGDARILRDRLVDRYPGSQGALDVVFFQADGHHDSRRLDEAVAGYGRVVSMSPSADRAGLARMRWAQIHLHRDEPAAAADVYSSYLAEFPSGRRWEEASYWGAQALAGAGDAGAARALLERLERESPYSYYAFLARADAADGGDAASLMTMALPADPRASSAVPAPPPGACIPEPPPAWLARELETLAALDAAGLATGASAHLATVRTAVWDSDDLLLRLGSALVERGRAVDGIRLGLELRSRDRPWSCALLRLVYPLPHRAMLDARAQELGLDPYLVAGLIRQESAFQASVSSPAGAIGLMQVMPATGRQLARGSGIQGFGVAMLRNPEINLHLGTDFLAEVAERYDGDIPLVLSAYNAGPSRASRWQRMPEAEDPLRFIERIPFAETRGYVKNVVRNRALYRWLYGPR